MLKPFKVEPAEYREKIEQLSEKKTYEPEIEVARKAPAVICAVASRVKRLREAYQKLLLENRKEELGSVIRVHKVEALLREILSPLPFEKELLSGEIEQVDFAIRNFPEATVTPTTRD